MDELTSDIKDGRTTRYYRVETSWREISEAELWNQVQKYRSALQKQLDRINAGDESIELSVLLVKNSRIGQLQSIAKSQK